MIFVHRIDSYVWEKARSFGVGSVDSFEQVISRWQSEFTITANLLLLLLTPLLLKHFQGFFAPKGFCASCIQVRLDQESSGCHRRDSAIQETSDLHGVWA